ncbi:guanylate cyclase protein, partial [Trichomonas vaginalis G3]|uniref:guanylate cyclase protein n=1 Tax=Trichomonas vaginalis (strain ATCC PRA-98 / G3) TaxID=412133 RepID=UPI0021E6150F
MSSLRSYKFGNELLEKARDMVFGSTIVFNFYTNRSMEYPMKSSVAQIAAMIATHIGSLITDDEITYDDARGSDYLTATNNNDLATEQMSSALLVCLEYILKQDESQKAWIISLMVCIPVAIIITWIVTFNLQYKKLKSNKTEIMNVIVTLPKTVISTVSASFNHLKKNSASTTETNQTNDDANLEDMSRQEQNIIKVFSQITDGSSSTTSQSWNMLFFVGIVILGCVGSCVILYCYFQASKTLVFSSQHIDNMFGCSGYLYSVFSHLFKVSLQEYDAAFHDTTVDLANEIVMMKMSIPKFIDYFHKLRLGGTGENQLPFTGMTNALKKASSIITCPDKLDPPTTIPESAHCFTAAVQLYLTSGYLLRYLAFISMENIS